jgi:uncharacterized protein (TIGR02145 family)
MMNLRIHQNKYSILIFIAILCTFSVVNAQDTKPIIKPKPTTAPKPVVVKPQPKPITTQTENKYSTVTDIDGNVYKTVKIGNQIWMAENLKTTRYNDGTPIPNVTDNIEWCNLLTTGAYCYYDNYYSNNAIYGKLYNWYAVGTGKLAPKGWHVPTDAEWETLITYLGGEDIAGGKMKSTNYWKSPNKGASNSSGFNGLPAGWRSDGVGDFFDIGEGSYFWSSTNWAKAWFCNLEFDNSEANRYDFRWKWSGFSVRCVRD